MKKYSPVLVILFLSIKLIKAQETSIRSVSKDNLITIPYFGFPNFLTAALQDMHEITNRKKEQLSISDFGPIGLCASYLVSDNLALGGEISYESTHIQWKENEMGNVVDSTNNAYTYTYNLQATRIRMLVKLYYHFLVREHSDWYLGFGLGYNHVPVKLYTNAPYARDHDIPSGCFMPVSARTNVGYNHFFTKNLGINAEVGIGGPLISIGITAKF
jgi:hypothetical protein